MKYANERFKQLISNQKVIEINEKVYRDVKNYLEDKEKILNTKVSFFISRLPILTFLSKISCEIYQIHYHKNHVRDVV